MAQKEAPKTMHRSMQGKLVDMNKNEEDVLHAEDLGR